MKKDSLKCSEWTANFFLCILVSSVHISCDKDSDGDIADGDAECTDIGDRDPCTCSSGLPGYRLCYPDYTYSECECRIANPNHPCQSPGEQLSCMCEGNRYGTLYCMKDKIYSECTCDDNSVVSEVTAGSSGSDETTPQSSCPEPFSCVEQAPIGEAPPISICIDGDLPPFCETNDDCVAAGLPTAQCFDPGVDQKICFRVCN